MINSSDRAIWEFAKSNNFTLVTQDSDFNDLNSVFGFPPKIIWIRTGNLKTQALVNIFIDYHQEIQTFIDNKEFGCFELFRLKS